MRAVEFVESVYLAVYRTAIDGVIRIVKGPPGRRPREDLVALSKWFNGLDELGQERARALVRLAVDQSVFGMLAALDGTRALGNNSDLRVLVDDNDVTATHDLHDLFRARVDQELGYD